MTGCDTKIAAAMPNTLGIDLRLSGWARTSSPSDTHIRMIRGSHSFLELRMSKSIRRLRQLAFVRQSGLCCYCQSQMWITDCAQFAQLFGITVTTARQRQCTAEHLLPVSQGGCNEVANIVAACRFCNQTRHKAKRVRSHESYAGYVRRRIVAGRWHPWVQAQKIVAGDAGNLRA